MLRMLSVFGAARRGRKDRTQGNLITVSARQAFGSRIGVVVILAAGAHRAQLHGTIPTAAQLQRVRNAAQRDVSFASGRVHPGANVPPATHGTQGVVILQSSSSKPGMQSCAQMSVAVHGVVGSRSVSAAGKTGQVSRDGKTGRCRSAGRYRTVATKTRTVGAGYSSGRCIFA